MIENEINRLDPDPSHKLQVDNYKRKYPEATHRPVGPCFTYNCHGLTFASRRTQIWKPEEVQKVLNDDGYKEIKRNDVMIGDIAIYVEATGEISHSGLIVKVEPMMNLPIKQIYVLSKWGDLQEVIHAERNCPYDVIEIKYYRLEG